MVTMALWCSWSHYYLLLVLVVMMMMMMILMVMVMVMMMEKRWAMTTMMTTIGRGELYRWKEVPKVTTTEQRNVIVGRKTLLLLRKATTMIKLTSTATVAPTITATNPQ